MFKMVTLPIPLSLGAPAAAREPNKDTAFPNLASVSTLKLYSKFCSQTTEVGAAEEELDGNAVTVCAAVDSLTDEYPVDWDSAWNDLLISQIPTKRKISARYYKKHEPNSSDCRLNSPSVKKEY